MLLGQTGEPTTTTKNAPPATVQQAQAPVTSTDTPVATPMIQQTQAQQPSRPILNWWNRDDRPIMSKITGWWKREPNNVPNNFPGKDEVIRTTPAQPVARPSFTPPIPSNDFPRKLPNPQSQGATPSTTIAKDAPTTKPEVQQTALQNVVPPKTGKYPILAEFSNKIGRDEKFEWITGQFEIENGNFILYYSTPETVDKYQGRIVLLPQQVEMGQYKKGDLVSVRGQISQRQTAQGVVPIYRVTHASLMERPKS